MDCPKCGKPLKFYGIKGVGFCTECQIPYKVPDAAPKRPRKDCVYDGEPPEWLKGK